MTGAVAVYFSKLGARLYAHEKATLFDVATMIARLKDYEVTGSYDSAYNNVGKIFFVPDDTLVADEASSLDICSSDNLFVGVVPYPVVKTKAITHQLVTRNAYRPEGWPPMFARKVHDAVLRGDANTTAGGLMTWANQSPSGTWPPIGSGVDSQLQGTSRLFVRRVASKLRASLASSRR
jgi:hypothetical protein